MIDLEKYRTVEDRQDVRKINPVFTNVLMPLNFIPLEVHSRDVITLRMYFERAG